MTTRKTGCLSSPQISSLSDQLAKTFFFFLIKGSSNGFFCSSFLSQRPVPGVPSPALSINTVGLFSPNKQAFLPKKIGSTTGCGDESWDLPLRRVLHFSGLAPRLLTGLLLAGAVLQQPLFLKAAGAV